MNNLLFFCLKIKISAIIIKVNKMRLNYNFILLIISCISLLTGCTKKEAIVYNSYVDDDIIDGYNIKSDYDLKNAEKDGYVIVKDQEMINENKIDEFYSKTTNHQESTLTIVRYTEKEEAIIIQYVYKDETYTVYVDQTRIKNEENKILVRTIKDIEIGYDNQGRKIIIEKY